MTGLQTKPTALLLLILLAGTEFGYSQEREVPRFCATVATKSVSEDQDILKLFDQYASSRSLTLFSSDPGAHAYEKNDWRFEIDVIVGVGDIGSFVVLFDTTREMDREIADLKNFLARDIAARWAVQDCAKTKDFRPPTR